MIEQLNEILPEYDYQIKGDYLCVYEKGAEMNFTSVDLRGGYTAEQVKDLIIYLIICLTSVE